MACDASSYGIGAVLSEKPITYASRAFALAKRHYNQLDKEDLATVFGISKFHKYIYGHHFSNSI